MKKFKFQGEEYEVDDEYEWVTADRDGVRVFINEPYLNSYYYYCDTDGCTGLHIQNIPFKISTKSNIISLMVNEKDMVKEPEHYMTPCGLNVQLIYRHLPFFRGNAMKYIFRAGKKYPEKEIEDLKKAITCLEFEIKRLEEK